MKFFVKLVNSKKTLRILCVVFGLLLGISLGAMKITEVSDYKAIVDGILGGTSSGSGNADAYVFTSDYNNITEMLTERRNIAEQISEEGSVLLKNTGNALPLRSAEDNSEKKVTVLGSRAYTYDKNGTLRDNPNGKILSAYAGLVGSHMKEETLTMGDGTVVKLPVTLEAALRAENIINDPNMVSVYTGKNFPNGPSGSEGDGSEGGAFAVAEPNIELTECAGRNEYNDAVIVVIGRASGEGREYFAGKSGVKDPSDGSTCSLGLSNSERHLIDVADSIAHGKVIVLLNSAVAMEIDELKNDGRVNAIMWIGLPGLYGMNGVARIISGKASPSGRLSDTFAVNASGSPAAQNHGVTYPDDTSGGKTFVWSNPDSFTHGYDGHYIVLAEGLYIGYRYYETRYADCVEGNGNATDIKGAKSGASSWDYKDEMSYTFGFGLSYSTFTQEFTDGINYDATTKTFTANVKVKNTGSVKAKETVQLYASLPYTDYDKTNGVEKSAIQLVNFEKVELDAGEEKVVEITVPLQTIASYDKKASHDGVVGGYIIEQADYYFALGNGAHDAVNNVLLNKDAGNADKIYDEYATANADKAVKWTPSDSDFNFNAGIDASTLGTGKGGSVIKNQMADADYNYYQGGSETVIYLSRKDWPATFPKSYINLSHTQEMESALNTATYVFSSGSSSVEFGVDHSVEEDAEGNPYQNKNIAMYKSYAYDDPAWDYLLEQITFDEAWKFAPYGGAFCNAFFSVNAPEAWQIDGPSGNISRSIYDKAVKSGFMSVSSNDPNKDYFSSDMPCEPIVAATFNKELLKRQGEIFGEDGLWSRNPIQWAPGMNIHRSPFNSRNHEYYSEDPVLTGLCGMNFVEGGLSKGMILSAKHFAFNMQESFRSGLCQFMEEQSARELELRGFEYLSYAEYENEAGNKIGALGLMSSFSRVGVTNINAHTGVIKNILRGEWGFKGLISTDMVTDIGGAYFKPQDSVYNNVTFMATSNADNLLSSYWPEYNDKSKVKSDPKLMTALYENMHYYMYALANSSGLNGISPDSVLSESLSWWQYALIAASVVFAVFTAGAIACNFVPEIKEKEGENSNVEN